jgi:hypothetical protein
LQLAQNARNTIHYRIEHVSHRLSQVRCQSHGRKDLWILRRCECIFLLLSLILGPAFICHSRLVRRATTDEPDRCLDVPSMKSEVGSMLNGGGPDATGTEYARGDTAIAQSVRLRPG